MICNHDPYGRTPQGECKECRAEQRLNAAYEERNRLVALLSKLFPSSIEHDPKEPDWPVVIVNLPTGQVSWHVPKSSAMLFVHLPAKLYTWDGHTTDEKHRRIEAYNP